MSVVDAEDRRDTAELETHAGRRTVVTTLVVERNEALEDLAYFVGYARPTTQGGLRQAARPPAARGRRARRGGARRPGRELVPAAEGVRN